MRVVLDEGEDFNAYYGHDGLHFFHGEAANEVVYSGESPDIVCHELGHAVLDALKPELWDAAGAEIAAFHESFGDMSAMLSALMLPSLRTEVLAETGGNLGRASRLSRLAEQLGWALRQSYPDAVEADCLRNAANSWFYRDPIGLSPRGPASTLSSEPHSFSRVFTGAFLEVLAGMYSARGAGGEGDLEAVAMAAGRLLLEAISAAPVVPNYFSQVAAHMIEADHNSGRKYRDALGTAFMRHGILSLESAHALPKPASAPRGIAAGNGDAPSGELPHVSIAGASFGLDDDLLVRAPSQPKRFAVAGAAPDMGALPAPASDHAAASFVEDLFRRDRVAVVGRDDQAVQRRRTHEVHREDDSLKLRRLAFDCFPDGER
jgi:hypothetical protein